MFTLTCSNKKCKHSQVCGTQEDILRLIVQQERDRNLAEIKSSLVYASQRAVGWHEIQDTMDRIRARPVTIVPACPKCGKQYNPPVKS